MYSDQPALFQSAQSMSCMYPLSADTGFSHMLRGGWGVLDIGALGQPSAITASLIPCLSCDGRVGRGARLVTWDVERREGDKVSMNNLLLIAVGDELRYIP